MRYKETTQVPNELFDRCLSTLTGSEFKLLALVIRQTYGWRKERDRMNYFQIINKTGLSRRVIATSIQSLIDKKLIEVSDYSGKKLHSPELRKGKTSIFFAPLFQSNAEKVKKMCKEHHQAMHNREYNKNNYSKLNHQKYTFISQGTRKLTDRERLQQIRYNQRMKESKEDLSFRDF